MLPLRRTHQRQAVLRAVKFSAQPVSAEEVFDRVTASVAQATVYRNLEWLSRRGEIYRFSDDQGVTRYIGHAVRLAEFQCQRCQQRWPIEASEVSDVESKAQQFGQTGFIRVHVSGICHGCQGATT